MAQVRVQHSPMYGQSHTPVSNGSSQKKSQSQSRLEMMQADFQKKLLKEKEEKLIKMYEDNQKRAMAKVNRYGSGSSVSSHNSILSRQVVREVDSGKTVREFFQDNRKKQVKGNMKGNSPQNAYGVESSNRGTKPPFPTTAVPVHHKPSRDSAGRDKSRLLDPIDKQQNKNLDHMPDECSRKGNPPIQMKPQIARHNKRGPYSTETIDKNARNGMNHNGNSDFTESDNDMDEMPPNKEQLRKLRKQHLRQKRAAELQEKLSQPQQKSNDKKLTDFQKWKMEQDSARAERLHKLQKKQQNHTYDWDSDQDDEVIDSARIDNEIKRKERDLLDRIRQQQEDLERLQLLRKTEDEVEKQEMERHKKQTAERQRQKALAQKTEDSSKMDNSRAPQSHRYEYVDSDEDYTAPAKRPTPKQPPPKQSPPSKPGTTKRSMMRQEPQPSSTFDSKPICPSVNTEIVSYYAEAAAHAPKEGQLDLRPCKSCGRQFNADRLQKHQAICGDGSKKPRKVFNMTQKRTEGTDASKYVKNIRKNDVYYAKKSKQNHWRAKHEDFIKSIKYAKQMSIYEAQGGNLANLPPPPPSENPDYVECPYCDRKFNPTTAERHIPKCKDIKARPAPPKKRR